jgi:hypothetical protein
MLALWAGGGDDNAGGETDAPCEPPDTPETRDTHHDASATEVLMWVKLDDHFVEHPKILAAGPLAGWLYLAGLCYANRLLTDGFIPGEMVTALQACLTPPNGRSNGHKSLTLAQRLCAAELWHEATVAGLAGYQIHDYAQYQPTKKKVLTARKSTQKRLARWRKRPKTATEV